MSTAAVVIAPVAHVSFVERMKAEFKHLFEKEPEYISIASSAITVLSPLVETATFLVSPAAASAEALLITKIQSALAAANTVLKGGGSTLSAQSFLESVKSNAGQLLQAAQVKDPVTLNKLQTVITTIVSEVEAILSVLPKA